MEDHQGREDQQGRRAWAGMEAVYSAVIQHKMAARVQRHLQALGVMPAMVEAEGRREPLAG